MSVSGVVEDAEKSNTILPVTSVGTVKASVVQDVVLVSSGVSSTLGQPSAVVRIASR